MHDGMMFLTHGGKVRHEKGSCSPLLRRSSGILQRSTASVVDQLEPGGIHQWKTIRIDTHERCEAIVSQCRGLGCHSLHVKILCDA